MAEVVSLRAARKARERAGKRAQADANAAKFGRSRAEREREEAQADKARAFLDAHAREDRLPPRAEDEPPDEPGGA